MAQLIVEMKYKNEIVLEKGRVIDKKYRAVMKNSPFKPNSIINVNGVRYKCHSVYYMYSER